MEPSSTEPLPGLLSILQPFEIYLLIPIAIMLLLLICSALISGSEVAFFSLSPSDVEEINNTKSKKAKNVQYLLSIPKRLLATILIANNFVNVAIVILSTYLIDRLFKFSADQFALQFLMQVVSVTFLILLVGEVIPKVYATKNAMSLVNLMAAPLVILRKIFSPLSELLVRSTSIVEKKFKKKSANISMDELEHALELTYDENTSEEEQRILKGIVKFGNTEVKQIMKSRMDVIAFEENTSYDILLAKIIDAGFSRIPIYQESFDNIVGILYIKDLLPHLYEASDFEWQKLIRTPFFVPENKKIDDLLKEFQDGKIHIAVVVDEYGGTSGIVTLEDVIEEIVGDITDEFDDDDLAYSKLDDNNYVFEGKTQLVDFYKVLNIDGKIFEEVKGEADTLAGFLLEQSGKILRKNERVTFENYNFTIEAADKRRIKRIKVTIKKSEDSNNENSGEKEEERENRSGTFGIFFLLLALLFTSCEESYTPKPYGHLRLDTPEHRYQLYNEECPFVFEYPEYAQVVSKAGASEEERCFKNIRFPSYNAIVHLTYVDLDGNFLDYVEHAQALAFEHRVKANKIVPEVFHFPEKDVHGMTFDIIGDAASSFQFFISDSTDRFFAGSLYFNVKPNADSLEPVANFIKEDIYHLIESFRWKEPLDFPAQAYHPSSSACGFVAEIPAYGKLESYSQNEAVCAGALMFEEFGAKALFTNVKLGEGNIKEQVTKATSSFQDKPHIKAQLNDAEKGHFGMAYELTEAPGNPLHFYYTDSTSHFLYGNLQINENMREDSLKSLTKILSYDLIHFLNTLQWDQP